MNHLTRASGAAVLALAGTASADQPQLADIALAPEAKQLQSTVQALVDFGTRHTLSETSSSRRGIGAARRYAQSRFEQISRECGGCLTVLMPSQTFSGPRAPKPTQVIDVVAMQKGMVDPERVIIVTGHIDSRASDVMNVTVDAPGADDDASGVAAVLETARILSRYQFAATLVYGVLAGEEQGLYGGKVLADYARDQGWRVEANLNNDIVGGTRGQNGVIDNTRLRVFSEGTRTTETPEGARERRFQGGENDSPSRNLARYVKSLAEQYIPNWHVALVYRLDRFGRGGDHSAFNDLGFPAIRFTENSEDYRHQHQDVRTEGGVAYGDTIDHVDFPYLARVTATNALAAAAMAQAPAPPVDLKIGGAVSPDTELTWRAAPGMPAALYRVHWRSTDEPLWHYSRDVGATTRVTLAGVALDDFSFGIAAVSADGFESPVEFPGITGAFSAAGH